MYSFPNWILNLLKFILTKDSLSFSTLIRYRLFYHAKLRLMRTVFLPFSRNEEWTSLHNGSDRDT